MARVPLNSRYRVLLLPGVPRHLLQPRHVPHRRPGPEQRRCGEERVHLAGHLLPHASRRRRRRRLLLRKVPHHGRLLLHRRRSKYPSQLITTLAC
uniref:Uncharacterized protein n=1 Tax=Aegilops tauschii subsp. strangulata TaxID=200361 RepID=A0A453SKE1_AEGTS